MATVAEMLELVNEIAPFDLAEEWDNAGLLAGHPSWEVRRAMVALDLTPGALREAVDAGAQLIVTHNPILFHGRKNLREDDGEGALCAAPAVPGRGGNRGGCRGRRRGGRLLARGRGGGLRRLPHRRDPPSRGAGGHPGGAHAGRGRPLPHRARDG